MPSTKKKKLPKRFPAKRQEKSPEQESVDTKIQKKGIRTPQLLRGMKDLLPRDEHVWQRMYDTARGLAKAYGFTQIETPLLEEAALFIRSIGRGTDVVDKEMYVFEDRDGTRVGLRPEFTAGFARAYITHGMHTLPQPVKFWAMGPVFRHDRPQAGRYRQFHQLNCEVVGERDPIIDAELMVIAYNFLHDFGIDVRLDVNSMGSTEDRARYVEELLGYLRTKRAYLCDDCKKRMIKNPLRVLDCKEQDCAGVVEEAPQIIDWLSDASKNYFMKVLEYLDELSIPYMLRSTLVRGLDYYTDTVFELFAEIAPKESVETGSVAEEGDAPPPVGAQAALGGGGRYDLLFEQLGGRPTPACGFALGLERIAAHIREKEGHYDPATDPNRPRIFIAQLGEQARRRALHVIEDLRKDGFVVRHHLGKPSLKSQMELANKYGTTHTFIIGQKEVQDGTVIVRDMESGIQETIDQRKIRAEVEKLAKGKAAV